jgi:hypothetical protein
MLHGTAVAQWQGQHGADQRNSRSGDEDMTMRTQLNAAAIEWNHNEMLQVRSALKAGRERLAANHNEVLQVKSALKAGGIRRRLETTVPREDRLSLLIVRAGLRAGARRGKPAIRR